MKRYIFLIILALIEITTNLFSEKIEISNLNYLYNFYLNSEKNEIIFASQSDPSDIKKSLNSIKIIDSENYKLKFIKNSEIGINEKTINIFNNNGNYYILNQNKNNNVLYILNQNTKVITDSITINYHIIYNTIFNKELNELYLVANNILIKIDLENKKIVELNNLLFSGSSVVQDIFISDDEKILGVNVADSLVILNPNNLKIVNVIKISQFYNNPKFAFSINNQYIYSLLINENKIIKINISNDKIELIKDFNFTFYGIKKIDFLNSKSIMIYDNSNQFIFNDSLNLIKSFNNFSNDVIIKIRNNNFYNYYGFGANTLVKFDFINSTKDTILENFTLDVCKDKYLLIKKFNSIEIKTMDNKVVDKIESIDKFISGSNKYVSTNFSNYLSIGDIVNKTIDSIKFNYNKFENYSIKNDFSVVLIKVDSKHYDIWDLKTKSIIKQFNLDNSIQSVLFTNVDNCVLWSFPPYNKILFNYLTNDSLKKFNYYLYPYFINNNMYIIFNEGKNKVFDLNSDNYKFDLVNGGNPLFINIEKNKIFGIDSVGKIFCWSFDKDSLIYSFKTRDISSNLIFISEDEKYFVTKSSDNVYTVLDRDYNNLQLINYENSLLLPIPAKDFIEIHINISEILNSEIEIYNSSGIKISTSTTLGSYANKVGNIRIDISNLVPGIYFIKVGNKFDKFIKI